MAGIELDSNGSKPSESEDPTWSAMVSAAFFERRDLAASNFAQTVAYEEGVGGGTKRAS